MAFKVKEAHWQVLLEAMEANPVLATGKFVGLTGKECYKKIWNETTAKLNALGFGSKSTEKWQKTWSDFKYSLKKKAANLKQKLGGTGGGPAEQNQLTELELKILDLLGEHFLGLNEPESGVSCTILQPIELEPQQSISTAPVDYPVPSGTIQDSSTRKRKMDEPPSPKKKRNVEYSKQYRETINELTDIKSTIKNSLAEISNNLKEIVSEIRSSNSSLIQALKDILQVHYEEL